MLQSIRDRTHGWIAGAIISLLILSFALWGIHSYLVSEPGSTSVAEVNGVEITTGQLTVAYERFRRQLQMQLNNNEALPPQAEVDLKQRALQTLINLQVLEQASRAQQYRISALQVDSFVESLPEFQVNGRFSPTRLRQVLDTSLLSVTDFLGLIKTSLMIDQPRLGVLLTSFALPNEIENTIALMNQERDMDYLQLPTQAFLKQAILIPDAKVTAYYQQHSEEFKTPEQVSVEYIQLSVKELMATFHPTIEILKNFYAENSGLYTQAMQWKLETILIPLAENATEQERKDAKTKMDSILQKIQQGQSFSTLMQHYPAGKLTEKLQDWVSLNLVPRELQKSVASLTKANQISEVITTSKGLVLIKAVEVKQATAQAFATVSDKVKEDYARQKAEEKFVNLKEQLAKIVYENPESLALASKELVIPIKTTQTFTREKSDNLNEVSANIKVRETAFSNDALNNLQNSDVIQLNPDSVIVLRIKTHSQAALLPLKIVENQIREKLKAIEAETMAANLAKEIKTKLATGVPAEQIAQQYHVSWSSLGFISRHSDKVDPVVLDNVFAMPKPMNNKMAYAIVKVPTGYIVVALKGVRNGNPKPEQQEIFDQQVQNSTGLAEYEVYKEGLMKQAEIVVN